LVKALATEEDGVTHKDYSVADGTVDPEAWYVCTFEGGKVQITYENLGNVEASEDSTDIVIAQ